MKCVGCDGIGWIEGTNREPCLICGGSGNARRSYWRPRGTIRLRGGVRLYECFKHEHSLDGYLRCWINHKTRKAALAHCKKLNRLGTIS